MPVSGSPPGSGVLSEAVDELWARGAELSAGDPGALAVLVAALDSLDRGQVRVARPEGGDWVVDERAKRAVLLAFRVFELQESAAGGFRYRDRLPLKTRFAGVRVVPGAIARFGSYHGPGVVLMPSYTNVGAYVGPDTLVDTWATVGSCAQVGARVHVSGGVGLGGVLEPVQARPVIVEDGAIIGSRSLVVEGARVRRGAFLGAGAVLTASTRVYDVASGEELPRGEVPERAVAVQGSRPRAFPGGEFGMSCLLVLRRLPEGAAHDKAELNEILREHGAAS